MPSPSPSLDLVPLSGYLIDPIDWPRTSPAFREFFRNYFVDPTGLSRHEVDRSVLRQLHPDEQALARSLVRRNLHLGHTHLIEGAADLEDREAVAELRAMLDAERDPSRRLTIGGSLWRLERDPLFPRLLQEMTRAESSTLKEAHINDVLLLKDERSIELLVRLLDDPGELVRSLALGRLNGIELRQHFLLAAADLPHDAAYYKARCADTTFVAMLVRHLHAGSMERWPTVWQR